jgi:hypothetical protein
MLFTKVRGRYSGYPARLNTVDRFSASAPANAAACLAYKAPVADVALLWSTVLLQRFALPVGKTVFGLLTIPMIFIILREFGVGRLRIDYDRLFWFVILMIAATASFLMNFQAKMLTSYGLFAVLYFLFLFRRSSTPERFRGTLWAYQSVSAFIAVVAIAQFALQFVIDGRELIHFYGIFPDSVLPTTLWNTIISVPSKPSLIKSNGLFLVEPSVLGQTIGLAVVIEVLEFRRPWYLALFAAALLVSYSGTGLMLVLAFLPLSGLRGKNALLAVLGVVVLAAALVVSGVIDLSSYTSRVGEFDAPGSSGSERFVEPFWLAQANFSTSTVKELLVGHGPGTSTAFANEAWYGGVDATAFKLWYEYGFVGAAAFVCFFASCLRLSTCPKLIVAVVLFTYLFLGSYLIIPSDLAILMVLCTLTQRERCGTG